MVWFPELIIPQLDDAVIQLDTDRSKFIRQAVREHLNRVRGGRVALELAEIRGGNLKPES